MARKRSLGAINPDVGFQIAPMIDVVFVIMLFFMVMAGAVKVEHELKTTLPGNVETAQETEMPDELTISVAENGQVSLNDEPISTPTDKELNQLYQEMVRARKNAESGKTKLLVTVQAEETALYERVINVLDILAKAEVSNVTFAVAEPE
ncbi:MAG: ExbD/TolR family protein [Opitutia bacterium]|jgi:biopolymer transport protein ExbD